VYTQTAQACKQLLDRFSRDNPGVLILSFSKHTLDTLQSYIQQWHYSCLRLDKQQAVAARYESIKQQQQQQQQSVVYLANTATAGSSSGISMTGATRVIVYDVSWDPAVQEENALHTVFCNGQVRQHCVLGIAKG
jgi:SNF2 family DNA or RNA helicase